jgi:hypothetical protein
LLGGQQLVERLALQLEAAAELVRGKQLLAFARENVAVNRAFKPASNLKSDNAQPLELIEHRRDLRIIGDFANIQRIRMEEISQIVVRACQHEEFLLR